MIVITLIKTFTLSGKADWGRGQIRDWGRTVPLCPSNFQVSLHQCQISKVSKISQIHNWGRNVPLCPSNFQVSLHQTPHIANSSLTPSLVNISILMSLGIQRHPYRIRRKTLYYMYNIVFPCMMMSTLTVRTDEKTFPECCYLLYFEQTSNTIATEIWGIYDLYVYI